MSLGGMKARYDFGSSGGDPLQERHPTDKNAWIKFLETVDQLKTKQIRVDQIS